MFSSRLMLPFSCEPLAQPASRELRETVERSNASVLGFLLQGVDLEAMPRSQDERLAEALAPLRAKLDMIVDMLGRLSYRDIELPPPADIELGPGRIAWTSSLPRQPGDWLRIKLYFDPIFREPVIVFGQVTSCSDDGDQDCCRIQAALCDVSESVGENVARLALLTQRRQRAQRPVHAVVRGER
jgi:hypothetical protein